MTMTCCLAARPRRRRPRTVRRRRTSRPSSPARRPRQNPPTGPRPERARGPRAFPKPKHDPAASPGTEEHMTTMTDISAEAVKRLREQTGAGFMDCKRALQETDGDVDKAVSLLRERGLAAAARKAGREAREGLISSYIHTGGRVGVLIEVNCETDFVARTDQFQKLARDLAIQVAATHPRYVDIADIPADVLDAKRAELLEAADV